MSSPENGDANANSSAGSALEPALRIGVGIIALVSLAVILWYASQVLLLFFASVFLAVFFSGVARFVQKQTHSGYGAALAFSLTSLFVLFVISGLLVGPGIAEQGGNLSEQLPQALHKLSGDLRSTSWGSHLLDAAKRGLQASQNSNWGSALKFAGLTMHGLGGLIFAVIIGIFLASQPELYRQGFLALFPPARRERLGQVLDELGFTLWWWFMGQLVTMASVGILIGIGLAILGIPLAGTLGLLAAVLAFIPSLGPALSVIPAALLGLSISPSMGIYVCLLYLGVQTMEANVITPLVQRRAISLPPAFVLASELLMGLLLGGAGLMFATPLAAVALVLVNMLYIQDVLHETGSLPSARRNAQSKNPAPPTDTPANGH